MQTEQINMDAKSKTNRFGILFYSVAAVLALFGVALNIFGFLRIGTLLVGLSIIFACNTALWFGHLKR
jgi:hypothetical protein